MIKVRYRCAAVLAAAFLGLASAGSTVHAASGKGSPGPMGVSGTSHVQKDPTRSPDRNPDIGRDRNHDRPRDDFRNDRRDHCCDDNRNHDNHDSSHSSDSSSRDCAWLKENRHEDWLTECSH